MNGALIIDKPAGWTSHDVVARVRKLTGERRVGHTGTLDPFATGVLVALVGKATRLAQFLSGAEKEYEAVIRLGYATDTGDATGARLETVFPATPENLRKEDIETAMSSLRGKIEQTPPMYSAKKVGGRKLYELARDGVEIERVPVAIEIIEFELSPQGDQVLITNEADSADLVVRVVCSAGTYVRTLAEDFGKGLETGAHLTQLRRTRAGNFKIEKALTLDHLEKLAQEGPLTRALISPDEVLSHLPCVDLSSEEVERVVHGTDLKVDDSQTEPWSPDQPVRMRNQHGELIAVGMYDSDQKHIHPTVVIGDSG